MKIAILSAKIFGHWRYPLKDAATSFEEMESRDGFYWVYKCTNPIMRRDKGKTADIFKREAIALPSEMICETSVTLGAVGDMLQYDGLNHSKNILFDKIADDLFGQNISYGNFESPITTQELQKEVIGGSKAPIECCSPDQFDILKGHKGRKFTVLNTANNHIFDMGSEGLTTTLQALSKVGILNIGTNELAEDYGRGKILAKNGIKLGFVTCTFGLNGHSLPLSEQYRIHIAKLNSKFFRPELVLIKKQIDHCLSHNCDFIIASLHWGYEFEFFPRQEQIEVAHLLVEWGVDAIIGHHPHVIQPVEYYRTYRDPDRVAIIAYSLGSLLWGFTAPHLALSALLNLKLVKGVIKKSSRTYIENAQITPIFRSVTKTKHVIFTQIEKLSDHIDGRNHKHSRNYITAMKHYAKMVFGKDVFACEQRIARSRNHSAQAAA